jgi:hypothetical protein
VNSRGNLTACQALLRDLAAGESRLGLAKKTLKGLGKKTYLKVHSKLEAALQKEAGAVA